MKRNFRRPLILMTPKSLLRNPRVVSAVDDLITGRFSEILADPDTPEKPRRLVLCSGKVFYDLLQAREQNDVNDTALVRIEQFYPLNRDLLRDTVEPYSSSLEEVVWAQEEPRNRGAWTFMLPILSELFPGKRIRYTGRDASASPATASSRMHRQEQERLVADTLGIGKLSVARG